MSKELIVEQSRISYVDLPAIIGGTILAIAISLVLVNFGTAIGLAFPRNYNWEGENAWISLLVLGLWGLWIQILASFTGGYLAGRMRRPVAGSQVHEREIRDGAHGLLVWASGTVAVAIALGFSAAITALADVDTTMPEKSQKAMDMEHNAAVIFAFITGATSLVSAVASWWAATMGGDHRDNAVDHSHYVSFRK